MSNTKKNFFLAFLILFFLVGSFNSLKTGISFDEKHEELNWNFHVKLIKDISDFVINGNVLDRTKFNQEVQSFVGYGIGFQLISQPIQFILKDFLNDSNLDTFGAKLIAKHFVVFLFFFI